MLVQSDAYMNRILCFPAAGVALLFLLTAPARCQPLSFVPFHATGIYRLGEKAGWSVSVAKDAPAAKYTYEIKKNNFDTIKTGTLDFSGGAATIETSLQEPAMLYVTVNAEGAPPSAAVHLGAAIAPTQLKPSQPKPPDFDAFWMNKLEYLSITPMRPVIDPVKTEQPGVELSTVQLDSYGTRVHGYLAKPIKLGKFPAIIIYQYAGVYALQPKTVTDRAAEGWLAFDVDSHDMLPNQSAGVPPNYQVMGDTNREMSYFLFMYLRDARAVDYICSRPDWDGQTLVVMGTSMGGQQSLVAASIRAQQVTAVIVNEPSGADMDGELHGRQSGYPNLPSRDPRVMATAPYFDVVNFTSSIKAPVLAAMGFIDTTAPPAGIWTAIDQIPGPKEAVPMVESDHNNITPDKQEAFHKREQEVLNTLLHGGAFVPNQEFTRK
jgi:cephalosporin-C deacetylase-like acetyl esterase